jgi:hypothetical protein
MSAAVTACIVFACVFGGTLLGMVIRRNLPEHHLTSDSKEIVMLGMGVTATMSALVLALLIQAAKTSHDTQSDEVMQLAADFIRLDLVLNNYGPETQGIRILVRSVAAGLDRTWPEKTFRLKLESPEWRVGGAGFYKQIKGLSPRNDFQRSLKTEAFQISFEMGQTRALLLGQTGSSIPTPFLVTLVCWLIMIFVILGLFAPPHTTAIVVLGFCALSVSGAIFLILELDHPFDGMIQVSTQPIHEAVVQLGRSDED